MDGEELDDLLEDKEGRWTFNIIIITTAIIIVITIIIIITITITIIITIIIIITGGKKL